MRKTIFQTFVAGALLVALTAETHAEGNRESAARMTILEYAIGPMELAKNYKVMDDAEINRIKEEKDIPSAEDVRYQRIDRVTYRVTLHLKNKNKFNSDPGVLNQTEYLPGCVFDFVYLVKLSFIPGTDQLVGHKFYNNNPQPFIMEKPADRELLLQAIQAWGSG